MDHCTASTDRNELTSSETADPLGDDENLLESTTVARFPLSAVNFLNELAMITRCPYDRTFKIDEISYLPKDMLAPVSLPYLVGEKQRLLAKLIRDSSDREHARLLHNKSKEDILQRKLLSVLEMEIPDVLKEGAKKYAYKDPHRERIKAVLHEYGGRMGDVYQCYKCQKTLQSEYYLYAHVKLVHMKIKDYLCADCGRSFYNNGGLQSHIETVHDIVKDKYSCNLCPKKFHSKELFRTHRYRMHVRGLRPPKPQQDCVCEVCGMRLSTVDTLKKHYRTHSSETPFQCRYCEKKYKCSRSRKTHERQHTGVRPYKCSYCAQAFFHNVVRKSHEFRVHGNEEFKHISIKGKKTRKS